MNLADTYRRLIKEGHITFKRQYLSQLAMEGKIPFTTNEKGRKVFKYPSVLKALAEGSYIDIDGITKGKTLADTKKNLYHWRGQLAKQKHDVEAGTLIYRDDVERKAFEVGRVIRNQLLALPERLSGELSSTQSKEECLSILQKEFEAIFDGFTVRSLMP